MPAYSTTGITAMKNLAPWNLPAQLPLDISELD
jgi:hypothetical protein